MHPPEIRAEALALVEAGLNDCEISRRLGIPRSTVRDWRRPTYVPRRRVAVAGACELAGIQDYRVLEGPAAAGPFASTAAGAWR